MEVLTTRMAESAPNPSAGAHALARLGNRRRLVVFGGAFLVSLLLGQVWNFARSDVFRATSRLQISLLAIVAVAVLAVLGLASRWAPASRTQIKLYFLRPFEGHNTAVFTLAPQGAATTGT